MLQQPTAKPDLGHTKAPHPRLLWPWQWERARWWFWSAVTRAAARPAATPAPSAEWRCRTGRWWRRAARSKKRKGRRCKTKRRARGWARASRCSRRCRKARGCNAPNAPRARRQRLRRNPTPRRPGGGRATRKTGYLPGQEIQRGAFVVKAWSLGGGRHLWFMLRSPWLGKQTLRQHTKERAVRLVRLHRPNSTPHMA